MTTQAGFSLSNSELLDTSRPSLGARFGALWTKVAAWLETCADHYAAAAVYQQLSGLSDAELHKRGLSRDTLGRDVLQSCDRTVRG
jgi:hypothetical protein